MSSFRCIFSYAFAKQIKSNAFKAVTIILGIVIIGTFIMTRVVNRTEEKAIINVIDEAGSFEDIYELNEMLEHSKLEKVEEQMSDTQCRELVNNNDNNVIIKLYKNEKDNVSIKVYDNNIVNGVDLKIIENYVNATTKYLLLDELGINDSNKSLIMTEVDCEVVQVDTSLESSYLIGYLLLLFLVLSIMMYGSQVAGEITYTKTNRVMEVLLTSVSPKDIFIGTTLAVGLAGIMQLGIIIAIGLAGYLIIKPEIVIIDGLKLDISIITSDKILIYVVFFIMSYLLFAVLNAGIGSLVSKNEDIMVAVLPVTLISCVQMFTGLMIIAKPNLMLAKFFSYFPLTSAGTMVMRYFMGNATIGNVIISVIIMAISVIILTYVSVRVFVNGVLYYGNLNLKSIFKLKEKV